MGFKTKRAMVCRLCHKTDGRMKTTLDTHRDLAACFAKKQVSLGFPSPLLYPLMVHVASIGGHKMNIFTINIPIFQSRYRRSVPITNEFREFC
jgi:hypothetical protein